PWQIELLFKYAPHFRGHGSGIGPDCRNGDVLRGQIIKTVRETIGGAGDRYAIRTVGAGRGRTCRDYSVGARIARILVSIVSFVCFLDRIIAAQIDHWIDSLNTVLRYCVGRL